MSVSIIVTGAAGRMGSLIASLVRKADDLTLAGLLERPGRTDIAGVECPVSTELDALLSAAPHSVVIDFTAPGATMEHARIAAKHGSPIVIGTTGLGETEKRELENLARKAPVFLSPNMSVGINVLLELLPQLVHMLGDSYDVDVLELHHNMKKDAPSGTALRLAEALAEAKGWTLKDSGCYCREGLIGERPKREIGVQSIRGGDIGGVHTVYCMGPGERIEITHHAHSRDNFANGALKAARWLARQKPGRIYDMRDVLRDGTEPAAD